MNRYDFALGRELLERPKEPREATTAEEEIQNQNTTVSALPRDSTNERSNYIMGFDYGSGRDSSAVVSAWHLLDISTTANPADSSAAFRLESENNVGIGDVAFQQDIDVENATIRGDLKVTGFTGTSNPYEAVTRQYVDRIRDEMTLQIVKTRNIIFGFVLFTAFLFMLKGLIG